MKRFFKILIIGICFAFVLLILQKAFQIDQAAFLRGYWIAAPAIVVGAVLINVCYNLLYASKLKKIANLLNDEKPQEYITRVEALLKSAKGENLRNILSLNLAAGYIEVKQFDKAILMLEELSQKRLKGSAIQLV